MTNATATSYEIRFSVDYAKGIVLLINETATEHVITLHGHVARRIVKREGSRGLLNAYLMGWAQGYEHGTDVAPYLKETPDNYFVCVNRADGEFGTTLWGENKRDNSLDLALSTCNEYMAGYAAGHYHRENLRIEEAAEEYERAEQAEAAAEQARANEIDAMVDGITADLVDLSETLTVRKERGLIETFELDGKAYTTDKETAAILRSVIPRAKASGDTSALIAVMHFGQLAGVIVPDISPTAALTLVANLLKHKDFTTSLYFMAHAAVHEALLLAHKHIERGLFVASVVTLTLEGNRTKEAAEKYVEIGLAIMDAINEARKRAARL